MDAETWMNANRAMELGFADAVLADEKRRQSDEKPVNFAFSRRAVTNSLLGMVMPKPEPTQPETPQGVTAESLTKRLSLIQH
jgi:ATP-dependent Clp protease protease subunit